MTISRDEDERIMYRGVATATIGVRTALRRALHNAAFNLGLTLYLNEDRGWLTTQFMFTVTGPRNMVSQFQDWINDISDRS